MDVFERLIDREAARRRAKLASLVDLWGFPNWASDKLENHHVGRRKYGDQMIAVPISMHRELTRRMMNEHPSEGPDPSNPLEKLGRLYLGWSDIYECLADLHRFIGEALIRAAKLGQRDFTG